MQWRTSLRLRAAALVLAGASCAPAAPARDAVQPADLVLTGGAVYTLAARPWAEAVAIRDGRIVYVGDAAGVSDLRGPETISLDLPGRMVLPGFHDRHVHPAAGGLELNACDLNGAETADDALSLIEACTDRTSPGDWVRGGGWDLTLFPGGHPRRDALDAIADETPVYLEAADGHSAWVNTRALSLAGITADTPQPRNGRIEVDEHGEPTGTLREDAMRLVGDLLPPWSLDARVAGLERAIAMANGFGITSLHEARADQEILEAYAELERRGGLTLRVVAGLAIDPFEGPEQVAGLVEWRSRFASDRFRPIAAKIFVDGVIESHTAALLEPYVGADTRGTPEIEPAELDALVTALDAAGFQVHLHAIGDRAIRMALDAEAAARRANGPRDARPIVAHVQLFAPEDIPRFRQLGVIASVQPLWAYKDSYIRDLTEPVLGPERSAWLYPVRSLIQSGAVVAFGSDWSVSSMNPLDGIQVAMTRRGLSGSTEDSWLPEQRIDLPTALAAYTRNGAYAAFAEEETGTIETGKAADLIVLDRNLFDLPPEAIHTARVLLTLVDGREVYRGPALGAAPTRQP